MKRVHRFDTYSNVEVRLARTRPEYEKLRKKMGKSFAIDGALGECAFLSWSPDSGLGGDWIIVAIYVDVPHHESLEQLINTCAHEAFHAGAHIYQALGQPLDSKEHAGSEAAAYMVGFLTEWTFRRCQPVWRKRKTLRQVR